MGRYTSAYSSFIARLDEVDILIRFAAAKESQAPVALRHEINALCRGAVVLLSSHLEAYIKELGELAIDSLSTRGIDRSGISPRFFYHLSKPFFKDIQDISEPDALAERLFTFLREDMPLWSRTGPFPTQIDSDTFNKGFSNPAFSKICAYLGRFGYAEYKRDLARKLGASNLPLVNMVEHLVVIRNAIAHGNPTATKPPADVKLMVKSIRKYAGATDDLFAGWWKTNFCTIR